MTVRFCPVPLKISVITREVSEAALSRQKQGFKSPIIGSGWLAQQVERQVEALGELVRLQHLPFSLICGLSLNGQNTCIICKKWGFKSVSLPYASLVQLVEHSSDTREITGSSPVACTYTWGISLVARRMILNHQMQVQFLHTLLIAPMSSLGAIFISLK